MPNVRAFRSGLWSDTNTTTSPWATAGVLYEPASDDFVYSNNFNINVDGTRTVIAITNGAGGSGWKDTRGGSANAGGTFNLLNNSTLAATVSSQNSVNTQTVLLSGENSATLVGTVNGGGASRTVASVINNGTGNLNIVGSIVGNASVVAVQNASNGSITHTGNIVGGTGTSARGLETLAGSLVVVGNVTAGSGSSANGVNNASLGSTVIVGNITASSATNGFISPNAGAVNRISGNLINNANGVAAVYATSFRIDPIPQNGLISYSNLNQFTTDSLSAFSMPPVSAVRLGTTFANGTLSGTCVVPSPSSVSQGVPIDNTVGQAVFSTNTFFDVPLSAINTPDSIGARIKNAATIESAGHLLASFTIN